MSDLMRSILVSGIPLLIMIAFFFTWKKQAKVLAKVTLFLAVSIALFVCYIICMIVMIAFSADPNYDWVMKVGLFFAVAFLCWYAGWCSQYKMDKEEGIARKID